MTDVANCQHCGALYRRQRLGHLYCSTLCRVNARRHRTRRPCDGCGTHHRGPRCAGRRSVPRTVHLPAHVDRALVDLVPWGERSGWIAGVVEAALEELDQAGESEAA